MSQSVSGRVLRIDSVKVLRRPQFVQIVPAEHDHRVLLGRHPGDGARTAPCLDDDIIRDLNLCNFLEPDDGLAMSHNALSHVVEEITMLGRFALSRGLFL